MTSRMADSQESQPLLGPSSKILAETTVCESHRSLAAKGALDVRAHALPSLSSLRSSIADPLIHQIRRDIIVSKLSSVRI